MACASLHSWLPLTLMVSQHVHIFLLCIVQWQTARQHWPEPKRFAAQRYVGHSQGTLQAWLGCFPVQLYVAIS